MDILFYILKGYFNYIVNNDLHTIKNIVIQLLIFFT